MIDELGTIRYPLKYHIFRKLFKPTFLHMKDIIGKVDFRLVEGADERIQLEALLARLQLIGSKKESNY